MAVWQDEDVGGDIDIEGGLYDSVCPPGTPLCFGDGSDTACPCSNPGGSGQGCRNSSGAGAVLSGAGSNDISEADLVLHAANALPGQPGLFFQADSALNLGNGFIFGNGLRCCGGGVIRLQVVVPDGAGTAATSVDIASSGAVQAGDTRCYQFWYRDPAASSPCTASFNLTNAYEVTWTD